MRAVRPGAKRAREPADVARSLAASEAGEILMGGLVENPCELCKEQGRFGPGAYAVVIDGTVKRVCSPHRKNPGLLVNPAAKPNLVSGGSDAHKSVHASSVADAIKRPATAGQLAQMHPAKTLTEKLRAQGIGDDDIDSALRNQGLAPREIAEALGRDIKAMKATDGRRSKTDWDAVQADRDAGMKVAELKEKYGVSDASIYTKTKAPGNGARPRAAAPPQPGAPAGGAGYVSVDLVPLKGGGARDPRYVALYGRLKSCPKGSAWRQLLSELPRLPKNPRYATGAVRGALARQARAERREDLEHPHVRIAEGWLYVWV